MPKEIIFPEIAFVRFTNDPAKYYSMSKIFEHLIVRRAATLDY